MARSGLDVCVLGVPELNGVLVLIWRGRPTPAHRHPMLVRWREAPSIAGTFALFCLGVVFFRSPSFHDATVVPEGLATLQDGATGSAAGSLVPLALLVVLALDLDERHRRLRAIREVRSKVNLGGVATKGEAAAEAFPAQRRPVTVGLALGLGLVGLIVFSGGTPTPFIYFQF